MTTDVDRMLEVERCFTPAPAGCGKTELIARFAARVEGRQLILTHTHAGVAAVRARLRRQHGVPQALYRVDTIAGWCTRLATAYPNISDYTDREDGTPDWDRIYECATRVLETPLGAALLRESYEGVLVDEYQDCSEQQHLLITHLARFLPCRAVGDFMQAIFDFPEDPTVSQFAVGRFYTPMPALDVPWRWRTDGRNSELGDWLMVIRQRLEQGQAVHVSEAAPVEWLAYEGWQSVGDAAFVNRPDGQTIAVIVRRPGLCRQLAQRFGGRWPVVERFDDPDLMECAARMAAGPGPEAVTALVRFLIPRATKLSGALKAPTDALARGRRLDRFRKHRDLVDLMQDMADAATPERALALLNAILSSSNFWLYRRECVYQLRSALQECDEGLHQLPDEASAARTRARHRGRLTPRRVIGTPHLVKGLEFDHAIVVSGPQQPLSRRELYVALTRPSRTLTVVSATRTILGPS